MIASNLGWPYYYVIMTPGGVIVGANWNLKRRKKRECTTCFFFVVFLDIYARSE